jgi:RNA polymerase sigma factor (sigma-70 family)
LAIARENTEVSQTVRRERRRLLDFIRRRVSSDEDAEDILQDVFSQFITTINEGPIDSAASWLYRVASNRIVDFYRKKRPERIERKDSDAEDDTPFDYFEEALADPDARPDDRYLRSRVMEEFNEALGNLPKEQRELFIKQELEGQSFKEIAEESGVPINTLLSRKRYAVLGLRARLQDLYDEFFG